MNKTIKTATVAVASLIAFTNAFAGQPARPSADKWQYHLFNPTPMNLMRDMSTDRPDQTESPITVDAGHVQIETDIVSWTRDGGSDEFNFLNTNWKIGLLNNVDLQIVTPIYNIVDNAAGGEDDGFGDIETRLKINLWGNDGGSTAFALMPFIKWPTASDEIASNDSIEGGIIAPLSVDLGNGWGVVFMYELDIAKDDGGDGYHADHIGSISFAKELNEQWGWYIECFTVTSSDSDTPNTVQVDSGLTYGIGDNMQFDFGANVGVNDAAPDVNPFVGFTVRF